MLPLLLWDPNVCKPYTMLRDSGLAIFAFNPPYFANAPLEHPPGLPGPGDVLKGDLLPRAEAIRVV